MNWSFVDGKLFFGAAEYPFSGNAIDGCVEIDGCEYSAAECKGNVEWTWQVQETDDVLHITAFLENKSNETVKIDHWNVLRGGTDAFTATVSGKNTFVFGYLPWNITVKEFSGSDSVHTDSIMLFVEKHSGKSLLISFETIDRMFSSHHITWDNGKCSAYFAECATGNYKLQPGKKIASEKITVRFCDNPYTALENWADRLNKYYKPDLSLEPVIVFCNGWRDMFTLPDRDPSTEVPAIIEKVKEHFQHYCACTMYDFPHNTMKNGLPGNWLSYEKSLSGEDFGSFFRKLHEEEGWNFKTWFSPFWFFGEADGILEENIDNIQKNIDGSPWMQKFCDWEFARREYTAKFLHKYFLDGTHPATKEHLKKILLEKRKNGVRSYMLDFLYLPPDAVRYDESLLPVEAARKILRDIREIVGDDTHLQTAVASSPVFIGCVNSARVVRDYCENRPMHPFSGWRNATYCRHDEHFANVHAYLQNASGSYFTHGKIFMNDLNEILVDEPVPLEIARINVTMIGLSGDSPVVVSDDLAVISPERLRMLKMCFPRTKGVPRPVDLFTRTSAEGGCRILTKKIKTDYEEYILAAVFNTVPGEDTYSEDISLELLGCSPEGEYRIYEFWNNEYIGTYKGAFPCTVQNEQCRLFRIAEARNYPWLLSTNMHIEQGSCEIKELKWDSEKLILSGKVCRHAGEQGRISFLVPWNYRILNHGSVNTMKEVIDMQTVASLNIFFKNDTEDFELHFAKNETEYVTRVNWLPYPTITEWLAYVDEHRADYHPCRVLKG